jgi:hypothetical protein
MMSTLFSISLQLFNGLNPSFRVASMIVHSMKDLMPNDIDASEPQVRQNSLVSRRRLKMQQ